jgi:hypothetical protein
MSVTHASGLRDTIATAVKDAHDAGSGSGKSIDLRDGSTKVVGFVPSATAFAVPSSHVIALNGVPIDAVAVASGEVDNFITRDKSGNAVLSGSVTAVGMGGDIEVTNTNIANGQDCTLESLTYTPPV